MARVTREGIDAANRIMAQRLERRMKIDTVAVAKQTGLSEGAVRAVLAQLMAMRATPPARAQVLLDLADQLIGQADALRQMALTIEQENG